MRRIVSIAAVLASLLLVATAGATVRKVSLTTPVQAGEDAALTVTVSPRARCTIEVIYDTVVLRNGRKVRFVQIDTPEVFFGSECYGRQASATTKRLLSVGARVRLFAEPATDRVDDYGRLLRYVVRASDGVNVNLRLVADGAAAPYFYEGRRGRYANRLEALAKRARAKKLGLWGACLHTPYDPYRGVETRR